MPVSATDQKILALLDSSPVTDIAGVVALMQSIDGALPGDDGLKWFNLLYLKVTQTVDAQPKTGFWRDTAWLTRVDVVFAQLYFGALKEWIQASPALPDAWRMLFERRSSPGIARIQFALAGMNAHINHDLAQALLEADQGLGLAPSKTGPEHADFETVNGLLEAVLPEALAFLATGVLGLLAEDSGKIGDALAMWSIRAARDAAWDFADACRALTGEELRLALAAQNGATGALGRGLLA